ncbi:Phospholipase B-like 1 [Tetrabaena socialis]|uniref:Phospholipase B-like n=1 Tax=Tetrabaena socialis TaxID=47790 RepID=A0A2J8AHN1_9CHLO|nr:Phospholipase B-like 1 [Tetrabaena socialis]|eukprot:PNH12034.1 Phospholipase B-like 1 [Tetrabaena socialis]
MSVIADATSDLEWGHWPSYNVPFFPEVYEATGYRRHAAALAAKGPDYAAAAAGLSYQLAPRAKIFRRDAGGRALELSADAINGPTTEDGQPAFSWAAHPRFSRVPHRGMLETFDTEWEEQRP